MPVISAKMIQKPRKKRECEWCGLVIVGPQLRLYGMAEQGDPPYVMYLHRECTDAPEITEKLAGTAGGE